MQVNVGGYDRIARIAVGLLLAVVGVAGYAGVVALALGPLPQALASVLAFVAGAILLGTGLARTCLLYRIVGFSTAGNADAGVASGSEDERGAERPS
jgi:hypothetical protein